MKKKIKSQFCFLVGANFILWEDSSNIEYSESAIILFGNNIAPMEMMNNLRD